MKMAGEEKNMVRPNGQEEKIFVSVRLRPLNDKEISRRDLQDWECINDTTLLYKNNLSISERSMYPSAYSFDRVFSSDCSTRQVYEEGAREVALSVVNGINASVFAYGQTSSGKTYTMTGITDYTLTDIYEYIKKHNEREFSLKFSAMEIYNESVRDLLSSDSSPLRLLDDPEKGTVVEKLIEETLRDWNHLIELLSICKAQRQIGETALNEVSSRSHQIMRLTIESSTRQLLANDKLSTLTATVNFVDLAGSERASQSLSAGTRLKEGCHINRSLLTLGSVIRKLSKAKSGHVPFRDSKLTRILQSSLGGNARTAIICTMSPARTHVEQSRNTLLFASCAKEVATNAQVNELMSDKALVKHLQRELARLESEKETPVRSLMEFDSVVLLREKDFEIEKLKNEISQLTTKLDLALSQVEDLRQLVGEDSPSREAVRIDHYPELRVRTSWDSFHPTADLSIMVEPHSHDDSLGSSNTSTSSGTHSRSSSDDNLFQLPDFPVNFPPTSSPHALSVTTPGSIRSEVHDEVIEEQDGKNSDDHCREVRCIEIENSSVDKYPDSNVSESSPSRYEDVSMSLTDVNTLNSTYMETEVKQEVSSYKLKDESSTDSTDQHFKNPSPDKPSPWIIDGVISRSRSCKASFFTSTSSSPQLWIREKTENTPPSWFLKDFTGRAENIQTTIPMLNFDVGNERVSTNEEIDRQKLSVIEEIDRQRLSANEEVDRQRLSANEEVDRQRLSANEEVDRHRLPSNEELDRQTPESPTEECPCLSTLTGEIKEVTNVENVKFSRLTGEMKDTTNIDNVKQPAQQEVEETETKPVLSTKSVKDVALDPIEDCSGSSIAWPLEFKRLRSEILELWHACNVSLAHRTYFFLLFKGDPKDSIYLEVEHRRLSFIKNIFSQGIKTLEDGRILTSSSSMRDLNRERHRLSQEMRKKLSREERENLFLKWGVGLNTKHRRMQIAHRLWSNPKDIEHANESATVVAKLLSLVDPVQGSKEMFGLNFAPKPRSKKSSRWKRSVKALSFLQTN